MSKPMPAPSADLMIQAGEWPPEQVLLSWFDAAFGVAASVTGLNLRYCEISVLLTDDRHMRAINKQHRGQDKPTNVLSFPALAPEALKKLDGARPILLGDLVFALETVEREAQAGTISVQHHMCHLIVHGFLHLLGYDHENDEDAHAMETLETHLLAELGIANPYAHPR